MRYLLHTFYFRVTFAIVVSMIALSIINHFLGYQYTYKTHFDSERILLENLANTAALTVNVQELKDVPLNKQGVDSPAFQSISKQLKKIRQVNPEIEDMHILSPTGIKNIWKFMVDLEGIKPNGTVIPATLPGTDYDAGRFPQMIKGLNGPAADLKLETDEYGTTLSGYAPIRDASGKPFAVLGIDIDADNIHAMEQRIFKGSLIFLVMATAMAVLLGFFISNRVVSPVEELKAGVDYIKNGHWSYKVKVRGKDEIAQLAVSFNEMARNVHHYQKRLRNYFFESVKTLTMLLEAKDPNTLGHSQAVVYYSEKIALRMGVTPRLTKYFKNIVLLHDIGKIGIKDHVLLKPGKLSQEEFILMQQHPLLGESILAPFLDDPVLRSVVRHHHERQDGRGYPDGLSKNQIPLLVAIVTAADSYDAMTSNRVYRKALTQEEAIQELIRNKGTQFHPEVVDALIAIIKEENKRI